MNLVELLEKIRHHSNESFNEDQTKQSFITPFFTALNYDCFDPNIISLEYRPPLYKGQQACDYAITSKKQE
ncbi:hypothetical protein [Helicobacter cetorum]|uniref:hypothetical protein n=1 Tax=Helicobacter cetorum TaxID=138563 RepID=UPI000CF14DBD|nr:hypothetical protein [Helicobacter cetorum]